MKNVIKNFLLSAVVICLASSFTSGPSSATHLKDEAITTSIPLGGAFLVFAGKNGGEIKKSELAGQSELKVEGCAKGSRIFVFTLEVTRKGSKTNLDARSNILTEEMKSRLSTLTPGDTFEFKSMKAYLPNGKEVVEVHGQKFVIV